MGQYFIGLSLPESVEGEIKKLSLSVDPKYSHEYPLHLTLKPTFTMDDAARDRLTPKLQQLAGRFAGRELQAKGLGSFNPYNLHLKVVPVEWLIKLQRQINELTAPTDERPYLPHITIAKTKVGEWQRFGQEEIAWQFYPESLDLFRHRDNRETDPKRWESYWSYFF